MGLRKYFKKHQIVDYLKEPHHFLVMIVLLPFFVIDYNLNQEYYDK